MNSKKSTKIIYISFLIFVIHLLLYNVSDSYSNFLKNIKYDDEKTPYEKIIEEDLRNSYNSAKNSIKSDTNNVITIQGINPTNTESYNNNSNDDYLTQDVSSQMIDITPIIVTDYSKSNNNTQIVTTNSNKYTSLNSTQNIVMDLFSSYDLVEYKLPNDPVIFDLTDEYPYRYLEYKSKNSSLSVYIFTEKSYDDIFNVFDVISYGGFYTIKKVNNFGDFSFYINVDEKYYDNVVRIVFSYKNNIFGLKLKKDLYNDIKARLLTL